MARGYKTATNEEIAMAEELRKQYAREKAREYRQRHKEQVKESTEQYWLNKARQAMAKKQTGQ